MHKNIPKRVSQCHANHIFRHWMDWVQLWFLLAQCQSYLGVTKSTMRNPVKPSVRPSHKIKELKMASQFAKEDKATVFKFSYMITTVKYKASIGSWYAIPRCLKDLIERGKKRYQKEKLSFRDLIQDWQKMEQKICYEKDRDFKSENLNSTNIFTKTWKERSLGRPKTSLGSSDQTLGAENTFEVTSVPERGQELCTY